MIARVTGIDLRAVYNIVMRPSPDFLSGGSDVRALLDPFANELIYVCLCTRWLFPRHSRLSRYLLHGLPTCTLISSLGNHQEIARTRMIRRNGAAQGILTNMEIIGVLELCP